MPRSAPLGLKPVYSLVELAAALGKTRQATQRMLDRKGVRWHQTDPREVTLAELRRIDPDLWMSMAEIQAQRGPARS